MKREEEIKQYCTDNGFPYGACSSISSLKANIATEAIKWADNHPNGSLIEWQKGEPKKEGYYIVTNYDGWVTVAYCHRKIDGKLFWNGVEPTAWCKLSDIEPYKEETK